MTEANRAAALSVLLNGQTYQAAAEAAGCDVRTIKRWMRVGHSFRSEYDVAIGEVKERARALAASALVTGINTATRLAQKSRDETVKSRNARTLVMVGVRLLERDDRIAKSTDDGAGDVDRFLETLGA